MTPDLSALSNHVWSRTLPALRRRRRLRRTAAASAGLVLLGVAALLLDQPAASSPASAPLVVAPRSAVPDSTSPFSLAILVVDAAGARFEQRRPEEFADEGLRFDLSLDPVISVAMLEF